MRIWLGVQRLWRGGGTETHVITLAQGLRRQGHQVTICTSGGAWVDKARRLGIPVLIVAMNYRASGAAFLRRRLLRSQVDVLHAHDGPSLRTFADTAGPGRGQPKLVYTIHGLYTAKRALALARRRANKVIVVSATAANLVARWIPRTRLTVVPNGFDTGIFRPALESGKRFRVLHGIPRDAYVIGYCGRFTFDKTRLGRRTVRLLAQYTSRRLGVHTLIAGRGSARLGVRVPRVHVIGHVEATQNFFNACDVVIATGRTAVEAALCGVNVVALGTAGLHGHVVAANLARLKRSNFGDHGPYRAWREQHLLQELSSLRTRVGRTAESQQLRRILVGQFSSTQMVHRTLSVYTR